MKVLLDENLPHDLRRELPGHDVNTVQYIGWSGFKNGELLERAAGGGFDVFVTMDSGVPYQQNPVQLPVAVVVLRAKPNRLPDLAPLVAPLLELLPRVQPCTLHWVG